MSRQPEGEVVVSSGVSPSGPYHLGTLREVLTAEFIARELRRRGRQARHIHVSDDLDVFRKVPAGLPETYAEHLGKPLCDVPAPDGVAASYADQYVADLEPLMAGLHIDAEVMRASQRYRSGAYAQAVEKALTQRDAIREALESISGRALDEQWSPIQVLENGRLKNRRFIAIDTAAKTVTYEAADGSEQQSSYEHGEVKLSWRIDWPARWWLLGVQAEPFGRDHATKGGSYDTGVAIARDVFGVEAPVPVPYNFINKTGDTKKMSKSAGDTVTAIDLLRLLPAEVVWYFVMRYAPAKQLFFDEGDTLIRLVDEFGALLANPDKTADEQQLLELCLVGVQEPTVSRVPFSHLVASYQAALRNADRTLEVIGRTEYADEVKQNGETIRRELRFIDAWLDRSAPDEVKFALAESFDPDTLEPVERDFLHKLGALVADAPADADGAWFHDAIYSLRDASGLSPKQMFSVLYRALIAQESGPRAGWFLSMLPREWLVQRLSA